MEPVPESETTTLEPVTEAPAESTEAPAESTEAPAESTEATAESTDPATEAPAESTEVPTTTEEAPVEPATETSAESTEAPAESTEVPTTTEEAPVESTEAPAEPIIIREPDPQPEDQPTAPILNNLNPDVSFPLSLAYNWGRPINSGTIPVTMYRVNIEGSDGTNEIIDLSSNLFSYTFYNMSPYVTYTTSVRASSNNGEGFGPRAFYNSANPVPQIYNPPASATAIVVEPDCIVVEWTAPVSPPLGTYKYEIYCINDTTPFVPTRRGEVESVQFVYQFDNLDPSTGYTFYVRIVNNVSASQPTFTQHVDPRV